MWLPLPCPYLAAVCSLTFLKGFPGIPDDPGPRGQEHNSAKNFGVFYQTVFSRQWSISIDAAILTENLEQENVYAGFLIKEFTVVV